MSAQGQGYAWNGNMKALFGDEVVLKELAVAWNKFNGKSLAVLDDRKIGRKWQSFQKGLAAAWYTGKILDLEKQRSSV